MVPEWRRATREARKPLLPPEIARANELGRHPARLFTLTFKNYVYTQFPNPKHLQRSRSGTAESAESVGCRRVVGVDPRSLFETQSLTVIADSFAQREPEIPHNARDYLILLRCLKFWDCEGRAVFDPWPQFRAAGRRRSASDRTNATSFPFRRAGQLFVLLLNSGRSKGIRDEFGQHSSLPAAGPCAAQRRPRARTAPTCRFAALFTNGARARN